MLTISVQCELNCQICMYVNIALCLCLQVVKSLFTKTKKVVTGLDEEERNVALELLTLHTEMSPLQEVWRNCGQRGLCRSSYLVSLCTDLG